MQIPNSSFLKRHKKLAAMSSAVALVIVGLGAFGLLPIVEQNPSKADAPVKLAQAQAPGAPRLVESGTPFSFADLVERVSPAVVTVTVETEAQPQGDLNAQLQQLPPQLRDFFNQFGQGQNRPQPRRGVAAGSGFIIDKAGFIVTNNHVVENARKITVKLTDGRSLDAKLIGTDPLTDIALIKVDSDRSLPVVEFGDDRQLRVGDWVIAVGNPFNLSNTVTAGIVSSIGRDVGGAYSDFIQIDAAINTGNSGGPTFDLRGQVIGMNSMIFSPTGGSVGIGFAIPASTIHDVVAQLKDKGKVARGWLGIEMQPITPEVAETLGLKEAKGVYVANVVASSPAQKAGFEQGDIVLALNGKAIEDARDMSRRVAALQVGNSASFTVNRQGTAKTLTATIALRDDQQQLASNSQAPTPTPMRENTSQAMGLALSPITPDARRTYSLADDVKGVVVTNIDPDSDAADKLSRGDVVMRVNNRVVQTPQDVQRVVAEAQKAGRKNVLLLVSHQGRAGAIVVEIGKA
jgi:serine protease Do